jgi:predicted glycosyltransferase involved in capsule biosynthesis/tetratricopeptide (TPR) repeat protein
MVICLRAHENNSWIKERLELIRAYYDPMPTVVVLDFGSSDPFASEVAAICSANRLAYYHEPDTETYSPAAAHNRGFERCETDLVFFCDADCFGPSDMFGRMASIATSLKMKSIIDTPMVLPVYHLNEAETKSFFDIGKGEEQSRFLDALSYYAPLAEYKKEENFFIVPYSNIFLINRRMFSLTGGYDERFRGHGSEDFEYLTRLGLYIKNIPLPDKLTKDQYGPLRKEFFGARPYTGFRRFLEAMAKPAENFGLRVFHLYHERSKKEDWGAQSDWKREKMNEAFDVYIGSEHNLLSVDFLKRPRKAACLCKHVDQWGYYTPLREAGYQLLPVFDDHPESIQKITEGIVSGDIQALAIFNPHMKSHSKFKQLVLLARERGLEVIVIERGALPGTIYYDTEVAYDSPSFSEETFLAEEFSPEEIEASRAYIANLRAGGETLESMDSYEKTAAQHAALAAMTGPIGFIPLQLEDDMAVTMFLKGDQSYPEFTSSLDSVIEGNPEITFVIKPHPLSKIDALRPKKNLIIASRDDNVHFLLDAASFVVCYNSGVGLLSLLHEKPTATIGNAFYNLAGAGACCSSLSDAVTRFREGKLAAPSPEIIERIAAWFTLRRYSSFIATDRISEFATRKAHGYRDILVTQFRWNGFDIPLDRQKAHVSYSLKGYAWSQLSASESPASESVPDYYMRGVNFYKKGKFSEAGDSFVQAFQQQTSRPNLLRFAAEAYWEANERKKARKALSDAALQLPANRRVRLRQLTMAVPALQFIIGSQKISVPSR